jgi:hypothetical protein
VSIVRDRYADFGPTLACEKLAECHGLKFAAETVRHLMTEAGLWTPRRQRQPKIFQPPARRACPGELVQIDGSDHRWFEERAPACTLLVYVDDATSRLMHLHFTLTESTFSYFEAMRCYLEQHGKPVALYSDKASVLHCNSHSVTQYDRVIYLLEDTVVNCALIHRYPDVFAYPDGRIEIRVNGAALPCVPYDRLSEIDQAEVIDNKRLGYTLQMAQVIQAQRDDRRASGSPSRTNQGEAPRSKERKLGARKQSELTRAQWNEAILGTAGMRVGSVPKSPLT